MPTLGYGLVTDRTELLERMLDATTPNEASTAIYDARRWLVDHPDDQTVRYAMADLMGLRARVVEQGLASDA